MKSARRSEVDVDDLRTPATDLVEAPSGKEPASLPFRARSWQDFERILLQYAEHVDGLRSVRAYGVPGQAQHGIDLYGTDADGTTVAYQAKNVQRFTAASLKSAVTKFKAAPPPELSVNRLVICTACPTNEIGVGQELARLRKATPSLTIDLYDQTTLSEGLRGRPDLVRRLFGAAWQVAFCDGHGWETPTRSPLDRLAESLVRGPLASLGLVEDLNEADRIAESDPARAAQLLGSVSAQLDDAGFPGSTDALRRKEADLLVQAGDASDAIALLATLAWGNRTTGRYDDDDTDLRRLAGLVEFQQENGATAFVRTCQAIDSWYQSPNALASRATEHALQVDAAGGPLCAEVVLWCAETAVAERQTIRSGALVEAITRLIEERASQELGDEVSVRLRTALADLGGDWTQILRDARAGWLGARMATLVHARYGRHLLLNGQAEDSEAEYSAAVTTACHAQLGNEAASALFAIANARMRYGLFLEDLNTLPRMALDLQRQEHTAGLLPGRAPADSGASALADGNLPRAFRHYRAAIRHSVIRGDLSGERHANDRVAQLLLQSGEAAAALPHIIRSASPNLLKGGINLQWYHDLRQEVLEGAYWERAVALRVAAGEWELIPDDHVSDYVSVAIAATSEPNRSIFGPHVSLAGWNLLASVSSRLSDAQAHAVLTQLEPFIQRDTNRYHFNDDDHCVAVAKIFGSRPSLARRASAHLARLIEQDSSMASKVSRAVSQWVEEPRMLLEELRPLAGNSENVVAFLADYGENVEESLEEAQKAVEIRLGESRHTPGVYRFGTGLNRLATRVVHLQQKTRVRFAMHCMDVAEDDLLPSANRAEAMRSMRILAGSLPKTTRGSLFRRALEFAVLGLPESAVDQSLSSRHPLSTFRFNMDNGELPRSALMAAGALAHSSKQYQQLQTRALTWLGGDDDAVYALAHTLNDLPAAEVTMDLFLLVSNPSHWIRQVAAIIAARSNPPDTAVVVALADDPDWRVRRSVAEMISSLRTKNDDLATQLYETLVNDPYWSVRRECGHTAVG